MTHFWTEATAHIHDELIEEEKTKTGAFAEVKLVEIHPNGKYVLVVQGLTDKKIDEVMTGLRQLQEAETGAIVVLNFSNAIRWQIVKTEDLAGIIGESTTPQPLDNPIT